MVDGGGGAVEEKERGKPISLFAAEPPSFIRAREKSFQPSPVRALPPSFTPIIAGAGTRENNVKRGKKGRTKEIGTVRVFTRLLDSSLPIFEGTNKFSLV